MSDRMKVSREAELILPDGGKIITHYSVEESFQTEADYQREIRKIIEKHTRSSHAWGSDGKCWICGISRVQNAYKPRSCSTFNREEES